MSLESYDIENYPLGFVSTPGGGGYQKVSFRTAMPNPWKFHAAFKRSGGDLMPVWRNEISGSLAFGDRPPALNPDQRRTK